MKFTDANKPRVLTVIDEYVFYLQMGALRRRYDLDKLINFCYTRGAQVSKPLFFAAKLPSNGQTRGNDKYLRIAEQLGFHVISKEVSNYHSLTCPCCHQDLGDCPYCGNCLEKRKCDLDADIGFEVGRYAYSDQIDYLLLFAADGDFVRVVETVQREKNVEVEVVALSPGMCPRGCKTSIKLFNSADRQTRLETIVDQIAR
ncbi:MAG: NYN domain-containing protein [Blastocatellia bacterium]